MRPYDRATWPRLLLPLLAGPLCAAFVPAAAPARRWGLSGLAAGAGVTAEYDADIVIVGAGPAGLSAAIAATSSGSAKTLVLESSDGPGGRVRSDRSDGYTLDRGFAVFIEKYPASLELLDYDALRLGQFEPGSLVHTGSGDGPHKVADPLRRPGDLLTAVLAPVGTLLDKIKVLPLLAHVFSTSVEDLFAEEETDTLSCLRDRWGFSERFIDEFYTPFLEGIYLAPLDQQSSRMFHFIFKMFSEGAAALPAG
eukprot:CAMPEP_0194281202 /NCGR_PEP_ID=MMETSP0169-20130528/20206_1 /TAXON_ID=218684 /ORGANISM="Corethron pennatum, Strain L29A3" /LENGTH=252 /DNA_ID=CAMNT_0039026195 /DNA_START=46 /DNA_END=800 /DNA_ORIENTATION=+